MDQRPGTNAILLAFAGVCVIWGTTYLAIALTIRTIPPFFSGAVRFFVAGGLMYVWLYRRGPYLGGQRVNWPQPFAGLNIGGSLLCGVLLSGIGNGFVVWAQQGLPSGITGLFVCGMPVLVLVFDWLFFSHQAPSARGTLGVALGVLGVVLLTLHTHSLAGQMRPIHVAAIMLAEVGWALGSLLQRRYVDPTRLGSYTCLQMFAGSGFQLVMACLDREWIGFSPTHISLQSALALGYLIVFGSIIAVYCYSFLLAHVVAQKASIYALVNPIIALALGALVLHEKITPTALLCAGLVILGVALVLWGGHVRTASKRGYQKILRPSEQ